MRHGIGDAAIAQVFVSRLAQTCASLSSTSGGRNGFTVCSDEGGGQHRAIRLQGVRVRVLYSVEQIAFCLKIESGRASGTAYLLWRTSRW